MNIFYTNVGAGQRMPSTWQSWLLRLSTFVAVAAASWYTFMKNYAALGLSEYSGMLQTVGNPTVMFVLTYVIGSLIFYLLYTLFARISYNFLSRQLFFFDSALTMYEFRLRTDAAVIALCVFKALVSVVYMSFPVYESIIRAVLNPIAAALCFGGALYALIIRVGKENKEAVICSIGLLFCLPMVFA